MAWVIIIIMVLHGLIHLMGGVSELGIAPIPELSGKTLFPFPEFMHQVFGIVWFIVVLLFLVSAIGLAIKQSWWKPFALYAAIVSQVLIIIWWPDAKWGTIPNIIVFLAYLLL